MVESLISKLCKLEGLLSLELDEDFSGLWDLTVVDEVGLINLWEDCSRPKCLTPQSRKCAWDFSSNEPTWKMKMKNRRMKRKMRETVKSAEKRVEEYQDNNNNNMRMTHGWRAQDTFSQCHDRHLRESHVLQFWWRCITFPCAKRSLFTFRSVRSFCSSFLAASMTLSLSVPMRGLRWNYPNFLRLNCLFLSSSFSGLTRDPELCGEVYSFPRLVGLAFATGELSLEVVSCPRFDKAPNTIRSPSWERKDVKWLPEYVEKSNDVEQNTDSFLEKLPLISFVCELFFGVNIFDLGSKLILSNNQSGATNSASSRHVSNRKTFVLCLSVWSQLQCLQRCTAEIHCEKNVRWLVRDLPHSIGQRSVFWWCVGCWLWDQELSHQFPRGWYVWVEFCLWLNVKLQSRRSRSFPFHRWSWTFRRNQQHSSEFHPILIEAKLLKYFLLLVRRVLSAMLFVSDRWSVEVQWFHDKTSHAVPNSIELAVFSTFGACDGSKNFTNLFSVWCEDFVFARMGLIPLSGKILYHDYVAVIVSRFENCHWGPCDLLLSSHQICRLEVRLRHCVFCMEPL